MMESLPAASTSALRNSPLQAPICVVVLFVVLSWKVPSLEFVNKEACKQLSDLLDARELLPYFLVLVCVCVCVFRCVCVVHNY